LHVAAAGLCDLKPSCSGAAERLCGNTHPLTSVCATSHAHPCARSAIAQGSSEFNITTPTFVQLCSNSLICFFPLLLSAIAQGSSEFNITALIDAKNSGAHL